MQLSWLGCRSADQKVASWFRVRATYPGGGFNPQSGCMQKGTQSLFVCFSFSLFKSNLKKLCPQVRIKKKPLSIFPWVLYFSLLSSEWHMSFCLTIFGIFKLKWIPHANVLRLDFLLLICCLSFELFGQKNIKGREERFPHSPHCIIPVLDKHEKNVCIYIGRR